MTAWSWSCLSAFLRAEISVTMSRKPVISVPPSCMAVIMSSAGKVRAVLAHEGPFALGRLAAADVLDEDIEAADGPAVFLRQLARPRRDFPLDVEDGGGVPADEFRRGVAEHLLGAAIVERDPALDVDGDDGDLGGGIEHGLEALARAGDFRRALGHATLEIVAGALLVVDVGAITRPTGGRSRVRRAWGKARPMNQR